MVEQSIDDFSRKIDLIEEKNKRRFFPVAIGKTKNGELYYIDNTISTNYYASKAFVEFSAYTITENGSQYNKKLIFSNTYYALDGKKEAELLSIECNNENYLHQGIGSDMLLVSESAMLYLQYETIFASFMPFGRFKNEHVARKFYLKNGFSFIKNDALVVKNVSIVHAITLKNSPRTEEGHIVLPSAQPAKISPDNQHSTPNSTFENSPREK